MDTDHECSHDAVTEIGELAWCDNCLTIMPTLDAVTRLFAHDMPLDESDGAS